MRETTLYTLGKMMTPFVQVYLTDKKTGEQHERLMLVDTCCVCNLLISRFLKQTNLELKDSTMELEAFGNSKVGAKECNLPFALGGEKMEETFYVADTPVFDELPDIVIGVLGSSFLQKHRLAVDFGSHKLYRSRLLRADYQQKSIVYAFPFGDCIRKVSLPMLAISLPSGESVLAMLDTGATDNVFSSKALAHSGLKHEMLTTTDTLSFVTGQCEVKDAQVEFSLFCEWESDGHTNIQSDIFKVVEGSKLLKFPKDCGIPSPSVLLGARFLRSGKFVMDFAANIIFRFGDEAA